MIRGKQIIIVLLVVLMTTGLALAQQPGPPREVEREAPAREPAVLAREEAAPGVTSVLLEIPPVADSYIASERPDRNFGDDALFLGYNNVGDQYGAQRPLLRFDLAGPIPPGGIITDARLRLRLSFSSPTGDEPMATVLRNLQAPWDEDTVTWNNQPAWGEIYTGTIVGSAHTWYEWEITGLAREWEEGTLPNHGLEIIGDEAIQQRERAFYSRETTTAYYPHLLVTYVQSDDTEPPQVAVDDLPPFVPRTFNVSWSGSDQGDPPTGIASYDVQYRVDGGAWIPWLVDVTGTSADFTGEGGRQYGFRARARDEAGNLEEFGAVEAAATVDSAAPLSTVDPLPARTNDSSFNVSWSGDDGEGSGIATYDVRFRFNGGDWQIWQSQTLATSVPFSAFDDGYYEFEARAVDEVGNAEPFHGEPEAAIIVDAEEPFLTPRIWLPLSIR